MNVSSTLPRPMANPPYVATDIVLAVLVSAVVMDNNLSVTLGNHLFFLSIVL